MKILALALLVPLAACAVRAPMPEPPPTVPPPPPCPLQPSNAWRISLEPEPAPSSRAKLVVTGSAVVPGWRLRWTGIEQSDAAPYDVLVRVDAQPSNDPPIPGAQVLSGSWPVTLPVRSVTLQCRTTVIAQITPTP
ncbi:MAG: hypothetical protein ABIS14_05125 [Sphingomonas sp.]